MVHEFDFNRGEMVVLEDLSRVTDSLAQLQTVTSAGLLGSDGKIVPAAIEARQLRQLRARLVASLRLPEPVGLARPAARGARGHYTSPVRPVRSA